MSLASYLDDESIILEAQDRVGGLARSFPFSGSHFDVGPHILFSKDTHALGELLGSCRTNRIRRSNRILHAGKTVKYPFENDLSSLPSDERDRCLHEFLNNPYHAYEAQNMLQFFLKTFGEGITRLYLQPYNEKIWKFDPAFMDTQMVERIPRPPDDDIRKSAAGEATEGYLHQLYFNYPHEGGIESVVRGFSARAAAKASVHAPVKIQSIARKARGWQVVTDKGSFAGERLVNCMPLHEIFQYLSAPEEVRQSLNALRYNSIHIVVLKVAQDNIGDNFAVNTADRSVIFHRLSKLNFLGENYTPKDAGSLIMAEVTFRPGSELASLSHENLIARVTDDLQRLELVDKAAVRDAVCKTFKYAYVIYDLDHKHNKAVVVNYLAEAGIVCCGRFAEFEYLNMDAIVAHAHSTAQKLNEDKKCLKK